MSMLLAFVLVLVSVPTAFISFPISLWQLGDYLLTGRRHYGLDDGLLAMEYIRSGRDDLIGGFAFAWALFIFGGAEWWFVLDKVLTRF